MRGTPPEDPQPRMVKRSTAMALLMPQSRGPRQGAPTPLCFLKYSVPAFQTALQEAIFLRHPLKEAAHAA